MHDSQGQYDQALGNYRHALAIAREVGNRAGEGATLNNNGTSLVHQGQYAQAQENYRQALVIAREVGDQPLESAILGNMESLPDK